MSGLLSQHSGTLWRECPVQVFAPTTRAPLIVDEAFVNQVLDRFKWQQLALRDIEPVRAAVTDILELISAELGD